MGASLPSRTFGAEDLRERDGRPLYLLCRTHPPPCVAAKTVHAPQTYNLQDGTASIERVLAFFRSGGGEGGYAKDAGNSRSPGRGSGGGGSLRGRSYSSIDDGDDENDDEILQDAREKLREGLRLDPNGGMMAGGGKLSPRRLFEYLDSDGVGEVDLGTCFAITLWK